MYFSRPKIKLIIFISYILLVMISELFYRHYLFNKSVEIETNLDKNSSKTTIKIFKILTQCGTKNIFIPILIIIHILYPLNISYTFLSVLILSNYYVNILKLLYGSPRPFWIKPSIKKACDGGYGNPSGHSISSFSFYLSFWNLIIENKYFKNNNYLKIISFIFAIILSFLVALSRIYLSIHSINQVIYGSFLGVAIYFYHFQILQIHKFTGKKFFQYITGKIENEIHLIKFIIYNLIIFLLCFLRKNNWRQYSNILKKECPHLPSYRRFNNDGLYVGSILFLLIGAHYGLYFFFKKNVIKKPFKEEEINNWSKKNDLKTFFMKILIFIPHLLPMIIFIAIPKNISLLLIFPFKVIIPYSITGYLIYNVFIYNCIKYKLGNEEIYLKIGAEAEVEKNESVQIVENINI